MKVVSWNILAPEYTERPPGNETWRDFYGTNRAWVPWEVRSERLVQQLAALGGDVVCLQEVSRAVWEKSLSAALVAIGYAGTWTHRGTEAGVGYAVAWRGGAVVEGIERQPMGGGHPHTFQRFDVLFDGVRWRFANVHLKWSADGNTPASQLARVVDRLGNEGARVICGDFNFDAPRHETWPKLAAAGWQTAYPTWLPSFCADGKSDIADGILLHDADAGELLPLPFLDVARPMPNDVDPSDHLPIGATLRPAGAP